ncbi:SDR family oxidoreductase [Pseudomonadota bacterium]
MPTRIASRTSPVAFDWDDPATWNAALEGVTAAYISYAPDLAIPGATDTIRAFVQRAVEKRVQRLVLLSGRGEEEAQLCERIVQDSAIEWTVVRASWFAQNFSEGEFLGMVLDGRNAQVSDGVERALGRTPADFTEFVRRIAATGAWDAPRNSEQEAA